MVFDKLKFWKKHDDDLFIDDSLKKPIPGVDDKHGADLGSGFGMPPGSDNPAQPSMHPQSMPQSPPTDFSVKDITRPQLQQAPASSSSSKDQELILAKLDTIKAMVENVSRRLERIEEIALEEQRKGY